MNAHKGGGFSVRIPSPPLPASGVISDTSHTPTMLDARQKLVSDDLSEISTGAWELKLLVERGESIKPALHTIPSRLRMALRGGANSAKVHLTEALFHAAKNGEDVSSVFSLIPLCINDSDMHVRNNTLLVLGYHSRSGCDISLYVDLITARINDLATINQEAALWVLKEHASKGKIESHQVLLALGGPENDGPQSADVRSFCHQILSN